MERPSPRTSPSRPRRVPRTLAILCTLAVASGPAVPLAHADNLHDKKKHVHQQVAAASNDYDDASAALVRATKKLQAAQTSLAAAERRLAVTQGQLTTARVLDAQMQAKLAQAEAELARAQQEVRDGKARVKEQRADIGRLAAADFQYGDPALMGLSVMLNSQNPEDLTTQMNTVDNLMSRESNALDQLKATQALLRVQEDKVARARVEVAQQRRLAAANLVRMQQLQQQAAANQAEVAQQVSLRSQTTGREPSAAPEPRQVEHSTAVSTFSSRVTPNAASASSRSRRTRASWPRRCRGRGPRPPACWPPKNASMMSVKEKPAPWPKPPAAPNGSPPRS